MGIIQKKLTSKNRFSQIVTAAMAVAILFSAFSPFISDTYAAIDPNKDRRGYANAATLYNGFMDCLAGGSFKSSLAGHYKDGAGDYFSNEHATSGDWFAEGGVKGTVYGVSSYLDGNTHLNSGKSYGETTCNGILKKGVDAWGFSSPMELLCEAGVNRNKGSSCQNGDTSDGFKISSGANNRDKLATAIKNKAFGGSEPNLNGAHNYLIYKEAFTNAQGCYAKAASTGSGDRNYTGVKVVDPTTGAITSTRFEAAPKSTKLNVYANSKSSSVNQSCQEIANAMNQYASAYSESVKKHGSGDNDTSPGEDGEEAEDNTCGIDSGWFVCPIIEFTAGIADGMYDNIVTMFVAVPPISTDTSANNQTFTAWKNVRNIANIAFILAFMVIIYSQVTSMGVSNYGVKKLLPRLIVAAILVNISYWVAAIAVDLSNILGAGIAEMLGSIGNSVAIQDVPTWVDITTVVLSLGAVSAGAIAAVTLGSSVVLGVLGVIAPLLITALMAIIVALIILVLRQAAIIIFVIISPLAFVAMLLPNTEKWFTKWRQWFISFLLLYPAVAVLFGGSKIAGIVLADATGAGPVSDLIKYASAQFVVVAPLFLIPFMIRQYGGNGIDKLGSKIQARAKGVTDKVNSPIRDFSKNSFKQSGATLRKKAGTQRLGRDGKPMTDKNGRPVYSRTFGAGKFIRYSERRKTAIAGQESEASRALKDYTTDELSANEKFRTQVAGGPTADTAAENRVLARALTEQDKSGDEEVDNAGIILLSKNLNGTQRKQLALYGETEVIKKDANGEEMKNEDGSYRMETMMADTIMQKAAIDAVFKQGSYGEVMELVEESGGKLKEDFGPRIGQLYPGFSAKNSASGGATIDAVATGKITNKQDMQESIVKRGINGNRFEAKDFASVGGSALKYNYESALAMQGFGIDKDTGKITDNSEAAKDKRKAGDMAMEKLRQAAIGAMSSNDLVSSFSGNSDRQEVVQNLFGGKEKVTFDEVASRYKPTTGSRRDGTDSNSVGNSQTLNIDHGLNNQPTPASSGGTSQSTTSASPSSQPATASAAPATPPQANQLPPQPQAAPAAPQQQAPAQPAQPAQPIDPYRGRTSQPPEMRDYTQQTDSGLYVPPAYNPSDDNK